MSRSAGPRVRILVTAFYRHTIFLVRPGAQVDHFAALGTERAVRRFRRPADRFCAARAVDGRVVSGHRLLALTAQLLAWSNSTSLLRGCAGTGSNIDFGAAVPRAVIPAEASCPLGCKGEIRRAGAAETIAGARLQLHPIRIVRERKNPLRAGVDQAMLWVHHHFRGLVA